MDLTTADFAFILAQVGYSFFNVEETVFTFHFSVNPNKNCLAIANLSNK